MKSYYGERPARRKVRRLSALLPAVSLPPTARLFRTPSPPRKARAKNP